MSALFGLTTDAAEAASRPPSWDDLELKAPPVQAAAFEVEGWDVTDDKRRPLRVLSHFSALLWLALRGVAGTLPFEAESETPQAWAAMMQAEAKRFRRR